MADRLRNAFRTIKDLSHFYCVNHLKTEIIEKWGRTVESSAKPLQDGRLRRPKLQDQSITVRRTYKYRLYPTKKQVMFLNGQLREACDLYNCALQERRDAWKSHRKSITVYDQCAQLKPMRKDGCLTLVNAQCAQDVLRRLDKTFKAFFVRCKRGDKPGFPRFRSSRRYDSITFPTYGDGCRLLDNGKLRLQGGGHIKAKVHRQLEGTVKTVTVKREAGKWYACLNVEKPAEPLPPNDSQIGIDVGLTHFATLSDGTTVDNPRYYRNAQAKLRVSQRRVARRKKGSHRRRKAVQILQRAHAHVANQRRDFHHKLSRDWVNRFGLIAVEDLNIKGLAAGMLAKSVHDVGWSQCFNFIDYKAASAGRQFFRKDPRRTSQECTCGARVPKTLSQRWHLCHACGLSLPRDHVSAQLILSR